MKTDLSEKLFAKAQTLFPGGVNSPVRAFRGVGGTPLFIARAKGSRLFDVDGNSYVDYVGSWGPAILGHANAEVIREVDDQLRDGSSYGAPSPREIQLAEVVRERAPWIEKMRFVSSGTEATTAAIRLARGFTGRDDILKFDGCYHGAGDPLLVKAGSGVETLGLPDSPGVPVDVARHTLTLPYNDLPAVERLLASRGSSIGAVILEPVVGNMGVIVPRPGYLEGLLAACRKHGTLLIVDEVMTGFRLAAGGACELYGIRPDLVTFGKVIGGGLPVGAFGGRPDVMDRIAPAGPVYQAGTLSGNPLAMAAGAATLRQLGAQQYRRLEEAGARLEKGLREAARAAGVPVQVNRVGSMLTVFFTGEPVVDAASARKCDTKRFGRFFHAMLDGGVYLPPSQFEAAFVSVAHSDDDLELTLAAARAAFAEAKKG
ncbi:MAG TPA: glutamate-1-semialdehyde 2,1-aminomutase [Anaeromyxobacteraceae bacterium]|nr:glutamate-1-semialdehyde 2,1-aminomutase [Anaeromyxobacteraceae bacterium]